MIDSILWMDHEKAQLFKLKGTEIIVRHLHRHDPDHHTHVKSQDENVSPRFYKTLQAELNGENKILVLGPGLAKKHFQSYLENHFPDFAKKVVDYLTVDHPTERQIEAYFQNGPIK